MRISFLPEFEGGAGRFEDFLYRLVAEVSPSLIRCSRAPKTICHSSTGQSMELAPGGADKIERLQFRRFFAIRQGLRNRTDSGNARRLATGRVLARCYR
jgi:hypothetical protein